MLQRKMFYVFCSKKDGICIREAIRNMANVQLIITASHDICSIKNIIQKLKKAHKLRANDYVLAIDDGDIVNFINDHKDDFGFHFKTLESFFVWIDEEFTAKYGCKNEGGGSIDCKKSIDNLLA